MKIRLFKGINKNTNLKENEKIIDCPPQVYSLSWFMSINCIVQVVADAFLELLVIIGVLNSQIRLDFLFLASISALLASHTLNGLRRKEMDVTQDSVQVSLLVEISLLASDIFFLANYSGLSLDNVLLRTPFMILTSINIVLLCYMIVRLRLFEFKIFKKLATAVNSLF
jgi:hypothetical protein